MSHTLIVRAAAKRHIAEAFRWYERQSPGLGADFLAALETVLRRIADTPLLYAPLYRDVRRALLPRFPYGVFYFTQSERLTVVAVLHTSRDPKLWPSHH
jgi:plasmid stabilization system protein ParE